MILNKLLGNAENNKQSFPSVIKNPFGKANITDIDIHGQHDWGGTRFYWYAIVRFKNGNTKGEQKTPECSNFEEVLAEIKKIEKSLE